MVIAVLLCVHWSACAIYYIAVLEGLDEPTTWTANTPLNDTSISKLDKYTTSAYWSMYTVTLVGYGDVLLKSKGEMLFSILIMLVGTILCEAGIAAILTSIVNSMDASAGESQAWSQVITKYMRHRNLPLELQDRIYSFFVHMHLSEYDLDESKVLEAQPRFIKNKLLHEICFHTVRFKFKPLAHFTDGFVSSVVSGMFPYLALPKEILISTGMPNDKVFVVVRGKVHEMTASRNKYLVNATLEHGSIFGDFREPEVTYRAFAYCELYCLSWDHYAKCIGCASNNEAAALTDGGKGMHKEGSKDGGRAGRHGHAQLLQRKNTPSLDMLTGRATAHMKRRSREFLDGLPIFNPTDPFRRFWNILTLGLTIYIAIMVPIQAFVMPEYSFFADTSNVPLLVLNTFDLFVDLFFLVDLALCMCCFNDFGVDADGSEESAIFWAYVDQTDFWYDFLSSFPFDHLMSVNLPSIGFWRLVKLCRLLHIHHYVQGFLSVLEDFRFLTHIGLQRMWNLFFLSALAGHWAATIFLHVSINDMNARGVEIKEVLNGTRDAVSYSQPWIEADGLAAFNYTTVEVQYISPIYEMCVRARAAAPYYPPCSL
jgi:hypothetical protein